MVVKEKELDPAITSAILPRNLSYWICWESEGLKGMVYGSWIALL